MIWLLAAVYILILAAELPTLIKKGWYREIAVFTVFFIFSVYMGMVQFYHWPFYNPLEKIIYMFSHIH